MENIIDLVAVRHISDVYSKLYIFKAPAGLLQVGDIVNTKEDSSGRSLAKVEAIYNNIDISVDSEAYKFICTIANIKEVQKFIFSKIEEKVINYNELGE